MTIHPNDLHNTDGIADMASDLPWDDDDAVTQSETVTNMPDDLGPVYKDVANKTAKPSYRQMCGVCSGTGNWRGRAGQSCYPCKGRGFLEFTTSPEKRAKSRAKAAERKEDKAQENLAAVEAANPQLKQWWDTSTLNFAQSLKESARKWGKLTENQINTANRIIADAADRELERNLRIEQAPVVSIAAIEECFAQASTSAGLKKPILRLAGFVFSLAPDTGRNAGAIYVKQQGEYLGKIQGGKLFKTMACDDETEDKIVEAAAQPKEAAIAYGRLMGKCAICAQTLTDPKSIERGIGPICASKFGW